MSIRLIITLLLAAFWGSAIAKGGGEDSLACNLIPEALKTHANAVVRYAHTQVNIISANEVTVKERKCITVLNAKGRKYAELQESYSILRSVDRVKAWLYDKDGNEVDEMKKSELKDIGWSQNFFDDYRYKHFSFAYSNYPYTVVYEVDSKLNHTFWLPLFQPAAGRDESVEQSDIAFTYLENLGIRHKLFHIEAIPVISDNGATRTLTLSVNRLAAHKAIDDYTPEENYPLPAMVMATDHFAMLDMKGDMKTWQDFGAFMYLLNNNRDKLTPEKKRIVHQLTDTCHSAYSKISLLYRYMQETDRYVSIQLGIGGWQTLDAAFVADKGYGDCKALSNYTKALLKEAGITAYLVLAPAGRDNYNIMDTVFPSNVFNHMILCVPQDRDTVWLECTSATLPAGYLSSFTADRNVLMLTPAGGVVVKTPSGDETTNVLCRKAILSLDENNAVKGSIEETWAGYWWEVERAMVVEKPKSEIDDYLNRKLAIPSYSTAGYKINSENNRSPRLSEQMTIAGSGIANKSGNRLFLSSHIFKGQIGEPSARELRTVPFEIAQSLSITDTIVLHFPEAYSPMGQIKDVNLAYPFGSYEARVFFDKAEVRIVSRYRQTKGIYPAERYADFAALRRHAALAPDIILTKKE